MATILRDWSFRYPPLYDAVARTTALLVGGEARFRQIAWQDLPVTPDWQVLDLCCGSGGATRYLATRSDHVTGLDLLSAGLAEARRKVPQARFVQAEAEALPFAGESFDLVHTSMAMHEMQPDQRLKIFAEVFRVLKPGGTFALIDFHQPTTPVMWPGLALFLWVFETQTAWQLLGTDLAAALERTGFRCRYSGLLAGGSLQVLHVARPSNTKQSRSQPDE
ncbi:MAG: class I SAM-dependent methyltransferase [Gemmatimonadaceae bacterium]|nr:class I SAM-dependent methyltransferase [Gloeobacterales cyanobacterium ES-bin-141]